jgi:hypothetical protein
MRVSPMRSPYQNGVLCNAVTVCQAPFSAWRLRRRRLPLSGGTGLQAAIVTVASALSGQT